MRNMIAVFSVLFLAALCLIPGVASAARRSSGDMMEDMYRLDAPRPRIPGGARADMLDPAAGVVSKNADVIPDRRISDSYRNTENMIGARPNRAMPDDMFGGRN